MFEQEPPSVEDVLSWLKERTTDKERPGVHYKGVGPSTATATATTTTSTGGSGFKSRFSSLLGVGKKITKANLKVLILGGEYSGKKTFIKHMRFLQCGPFRVEEREAARDLVRQYFIDCINNIIPAAEAAKVSGNWNKNRLDSSSEGFFKVVDDIRTLMDDPAITQFLKSPTAYKLPQLPQLLYYHHRINELANPKYIPTCLDILNLTENTSGIYSVELGDHWRDFTITLETVGGKRRDRRKWIHCFEGTSLLLYFVNLAEYDQVLSEDETTNRMQESLLLFKEVSGSRWFTSKTIFLVFTHKDEFYRKAQIGVDISVCFPNYSGDKTPEHMLEFIISKYRGVMPEWRNESLKIFTISTYHWLHVAKLWMQVLLTLQQEHIWASQPDRGV